VRNSFPILFLLSFALCSQGQAVPSALTPAQAQGLVERALAHELQSAQDTSHPMRYRLRKQSPRLTTTKEIVETKDGDVARLLATWDKPLSQADEQTEQARLDALLADPGLQSHRKNSENQDFGIVLKLLRMLPTAFVYEYAGTGGSGTLEKFTFRPNPGFNPSDPEMQALQSMSGEILIDSAEERVTRLEGHLQRDTDYGWWGVLGKLDKGGWIILEQASVGGHQWRIARLKMQMNLRILIKTKNIDTVEEMTGYAPVPAGIDYREAIKMLRSGPESSAQGGH
jgi:hypothetical protein